MILLDYIKKNIINGSSSLAPNIWGAHPHGERGSASL